MGEELGLWVCRRMGLEIRALQLPSQSKQEQSRAIIEKVGNCHAQSSGKQYKSLAGCALVTPVRLTEMLENFGLETQSRLRPYQKNAQEEQWLIQCAHRAPRI